MIEFRDNITALHLGAMLARAMGHRISLSPGQNFAFSFSLDDWGVSVNDFDMIVEQDHSTKGHILVTFKRKHRGEPAIDLLHRLLADDRKREPGDVVVTEVTGTSHKLGLGQNPPPCPPGEHEFEELPGEPPADVCLKCGAVQQ